METSKIFKVPTGLQKTILHMLETGNVELGYMSNEDKAWFKRWGTRCGINWSDSTKAYKPDNPIRIVKSTSNRYLNLEVANNPDK